MPLSSSLPLQSAAHKFRNQRLDLVNDGIAYNSAVKLLKVEPYLEADMAKLRGGEEKHARWFSLSSAFNLSMQLSVASMMVRSA